MASPPRTRRLQRSRLLGFGAWGYALSATFIAILLWGWLSPDPQHDLLALIQRLFGTGPMMWFVAWQMVTTFLLMFYFGFNLVYASLLAVAVFFSGRRITAFGYGFIFIGGWSATSLWVVCERFYRTHQISIIEVLNPIEHLVAGGAFIANAVAGAILSVLCRSAIVGLATVSLGLFAIFDKHLLPGNIAVLPFPSKTIVISTNYALSLLWYGGILFLWARHARSSLPAHASGCLTCGYDLANLKSTICPECASPIEKADAVNPEQESTP